MWRPSCPPPFRIEGKGSSDVSQHVQVVCRGSKSRCRRVTLTQEDGRQSIRGHSRAIASTQGDEAPPHHLRLAPWVEHEEELGSPGVSVDSRRQVPRPHEGDRELVHWLEAQRVWDCPGEGGRSRWMCRPKPSLASRPSPANGMDPFVSPTQVGQTPRALPGNQRLER